MLVNCLQTFSDLELCKDSDIYENAQNVASLKEDEVTKSTKTQPIKHTRNGNQLS